MNLHVGLFSTTNVKGTSFPKLLPMYKWFSITVTNTLQVVFKEPVFSSYFILSSCLESHVKLNFILPFVIPVSGFIISRIVRRLKQQATQAHESFAKMIGFLDESLGGIKIIKAFNATERIKDKFTTKNVYYSNLNRKMVRRQQSASPVSQSLGVLVVVSIVIYGGTLIINGDSAALKPADFIAYIAAFSQVMQPIKALTDSFSGIHSGISAGVAGIRPYRYKSRRLSIHQVRRTLTGFNDKIAFKTFPLATVKKKY
jgi:subfamily B ATP-binding cassette protein MsbA